MLLCSVSLLAVCRAQADEFSDFDSPAAPTKVPTSKASPAGKKATANPTPVATLSVSTSKPTSAEIERLKEDFRKNPNNFQTLQLLAEDLYQVGQYDKTTALLWKYVEKVDRGGLLLLARAHEKRNEPAQMIKALNILIAKDKKDYDAFYLLGNAYFLQNKNKEALENYRTSIEINPKFELAYLGLVKLYERQKNLYELRALYQDMLETIGQKAEYLAKICEIETNDGTFEAGLDRCKKAIDKNPENASNYVNLGLSYKGVGQIPEAEKTLKAAANRFPNSEFAQYTYAKVLGDQKNYVDAFSYYKSAAAADAKSARAWLGVATCALELQKLDISIVAFKKACHLDPKNAAAFRKASAQLSGSKNMDWSKKFSEASEQCTYSN